MSNDVRPTSKDPTTLTSSARRRARATPAWVRRMRYAFSAENLREFVTTLALVVPLTVLIWVWAEREQTAEYKPILTLSVHAINPSRSMSIVDASGENRPANVGVTLVGPKSGVDALRDVINADASHARVTLEVPDDVDPTGTRDVNVQPLLDEQKLFREYGVTVKSAEPATVKVRSDDLVTREVKVTVPDDFAGRIESVASEPATVRMRGAASLIDKLAGANALRADLDVGPLVVKHDADPTVAPTPGDVPLRPIAGIAFEPAQARNVRVTFSEAATAELQNVFVYVSQPSKLGARVTVEPVQLNGIKVSGPPDVIRRLQANDVDNRPVYAQVRIDRADKGKSDMRTPMILGLPAGVRVDEASIKQVHVDVALAGDAGGGNAEP